MNREQLEHAIRAASKLMAFREKDTEFVRRLILEGMIVVEVLLNRLEFTDVEIEVKGRAIVWVERLITNL